MEAVEDISRLSVKELRQGALEYEALEEYEKATQYYSEALLKISETDGDETKDMAMLDLHYGSVLLKTHREEHCKKLKIAQEKVSDVEEDIEEEYGEAANYGMKDKEKGDEDNEVELVEEVEEVEEDNPGENSEKKEEEDLTKLELARSVLEVARRVFSRPEYDDDLDVKALLVQTYILIGEVEGELFMYSEALKNYQNALSILEKVSMNNLSFYELIIRVRTTAYWIQVFLNEKGEFDEVALDQAIIELQSAIAILETSEKAASSLAFGIVKHYIKELNKLSAMTDKTEKEGTMCNIASEILFFTDNICSEQCEHNEGAMEDQPPGIQSAVKEAVETTFPESCGGASKFNKSPFKGSGSNIESPTKVADFGSAASVSGNQIITNISHLIRRKPADQTTAANNKLVITSPAEKTDTLARLKSAVLADLTLKRKVDEAGDAPAVVKGAQDPKRSKKENENKDNA